MRPVTSFIVVDIASIQRDCTTINSESSTVGDCVTVDGGAEKRHLSVAARDV
eukprot:CAMPEP_0119391128 /NCGR_PEP_ID=MMETSP1334-20130426/115995_1 /TAXON_ID=127549 /ORGANISM="Calcidiscus leptoporus, Strain RCC1130" /LENGTH=51 /DNA_ID=CAMNT_0007413755 /DNA_START=20 /DNA_END=172 /DNA_ORIENTATION=-